jgi:hypothetical protein
MFVGNGIYFFLKEGSSTENQGTGLCIVDLKLGVKILEDYLNELDKP